MSHAAETLTDLVAERVGDGRGLTYRAFGERAVDPETGYCPSRDTVWKLANGRPVKVSPDLVRAIAVGLSLPLSRVQAAAAYQFTGYLATEVEGGVVVHEPDVDAGDLPIAREVLNRWREEESGAHS